MRGLREDLQQQIQNLLDIGKVIGTAIAPARKSVLVNLLGIETDDTGFHGERRDNRILFGNAGILMRPVPRDADGQCEVIFATIGDDMIPIAHRDVRWQVEIEEGEAALRSMSETSARVHVLPDGSSYTHATEIKLGSKDASELVALASKVEAQLERIKSAISSAAVTPGDGGAAFKAAIIAALDGVTPPGAPFPESVAASKVKAE